MPLRIYIPHNILRGRHRAKRSINPRRAPMPAKIRVRMSNMGLRSDNNRRQPMSGTEVEAIASRVETGCSEIIILLID
jgi:hypothetical protein